MESQRQMQRKVNNASNSDFDWSDFNDAQVVDNSLKIDQIIHEYKERFNF